MDTMGRAYRSLGLYTPARDLLERSLAIRRAHLDRDDPRTERPGPRTRHPRVHGRFGNLENEEREVQYIQLAPDASTASMSRDMSAAEASGTSVAVSAAT